MGVVKAFRGSTITQSPGAITVQWSDGDYLVVDTSAPARNGGAAAITKVTYKRYERGFRG